MATGWPLLQTSNKPCYFSNVADAKVYIYRAADIEGSNPIPARAFDSTTGLVRSHYFAVRPNSNEVWIGNRPSRANGTLLRFNGDCLKSN